MTLNEWCEKNLDGGYKILQSELSNWEIGRVHRRHWQAVFTVYFKNKQRGMMAQHVSKRKRNELGVTWIVAIRP